MSRRVRQERRVHLGATLYDALQQYVHRGHRGTVDVLLELLDARPGDTVVEIGCGTGALARRFIDRGYAYLGIDPDVERINAARSAEGGQFLVGEATVLDTIDLPRPRHVFIHGVLHHLDDDYCRSLIGYLLDWADNGTVVVSEPVLPDHWWQNPAGELAMRLDEGKHVRRVREWLDLLGENVERVNLRRLWPRWPVSMLDMRLMTAGAKSRCDVGAGE